MFMWYGILIWTCVAVTSAIGAEESTTQVIPADTDRRFTQSAPYSSSEEVGRRLGYAVAFPAYDVGQEKFRVVVPAEYSTNESWGLFVWISPEDEGKIPLELKAQASSRHLLVVSAYHSGNGRHPLDRFRLALDATCNMCRTYQVDRKRLFVGGFSGGSRMASMLGVAYGDLYTGTLCLCGVNFYRLVRAPEGEEYIATYDPAPGALARAKLAGRFLLVTGETDPNRPSTKAIAQFGFKRESFKTVLYQEVKGMGHAIPNREIWTQAMEFLEPLVGGR